MPMEPCRRAHRLGEPRGAILIICLMLMLITAILAGIILFLSRTEATISANTRASVQAANAAEYGIQFGRARIDSNSGNYVTPFGTRPLASGVQVTDGLRNGGNDGALRQGSADCGPGYGLTLGCSAYRITVTGWAGGWLRPVASTQVESIEAIYQGCRGTGHSDC